MTKLNIFQNRRLLTLILLVITLIFAGLSIYLAITINSRNVNPDSTAAEDPCGGRCGPGEYCDSTSCPGTAFCCPNNTSCADRCADQYDIVVRGTLCGANAGCPEGQGKQMRERCRRGTSQCEDISDRQCVSLNSCRTEGGNPRCRREDIPGCGSGFAAVGERCRCESVGNDRFTGVQTCLESGWSICAREDGQQAPSGSCSDGKRNVNGVCVANCDGTTNICACGNKLCSGTAGQTFICSSSGDCQIQGSPEWRGSGDCRVATPNGSVGRCSRAEFRNCNPQPGKMCWCDNLDRTVISGYRYGTTTLRDIGICGSSCAGKAGGVYTAEVCGNPYRCPDTPISNTTPVCHPIDYCDRRTNERVRQSCNADGTLGPVTRTPEICVDCPVTYKCEGCDKVGIDCESRETSRERDDSFCGCRTEQRSDTCARMTVSFGSQSLTVNRAGQPNVINAMPQPGQSISFDSAPTGPNAGMQTYWMRPYIPDQNHPINRHGTPEHFCSFYIFNPYYNQDYPDPNLRSGGSPRRTFTMPNNLTSLVRNDSPRGDGVFPATRSAVGRDIDCKEYPMNFSQGVIFGVTYIRNPLQWGGIWCRNVGPNTNMAEVFDGVSIRTNMQCTNPCVVRAAPPTTTTITTTTTTTTTPRESPPQCTSINVTNTRNNATCTASNPTACNVRQGDILNVTVQGTGRITSYALARQEVRNGVRTSSTTSSQQSPQFNSIQVPVGADLSSFALTGTVSNGGGSNSSEDSCRIRFTFSNNPQVEKVINRSGSNPTIPEDANPVIVQGGNIVEYDITVRNNGNSVLQNVLVYDRVISINNGQSDPNETPIGVFVRATNLTRTTGSISTPNSVAPAEGRTSNAVPFTGTTVSPNNSALPNDNFTAEQNVRLVRWNNITSLAPNEVYTGKVRVVIQSFNGTPGLKNQVCIAIDTNNNGQVDNGEYRICHEVDIFTARPEFTIEKTSSTTNAVPGDTVTYTITLRNTSNNTLNLNNVTLTDRFDANYIDRVTVNPGNGGERQGTTNQIIWTGSDLVAANSGNANLAPNGTVAVTMQIRFNENFFNGLNQCQVVANNVTLANSTSPDANATSNTVSINMNDPNCGVTPTPIGTLPPTGMNTPMYIPLIGIGLISLGVVGLLLYKRYGYKFFMQNIESGESYGINKLREKIRIKRK